MPFTSPNSSGTFRCVSVKEMKFFCRQDTLFKENFRKYCDMTGSRMLYGVELRGSNVAWNRTGLKVDCGPR